MLINAVTTDQDEPVVVHFGDLIARDPTLEPARILRCGDLIVRLLGAGTSWRRQRFWSDRDYEQLMASLTD